MRNRLRYAGKGQIVREADGRLVSPRDVVEWYNDMCEALQRTLDAVAYAASKRNGNRHAEGVQSQVFRNGEAGAVANAEAVNPCDKRGRR